MTTEAVARKTDTFATGHGCDIIGTLDALSTTVFVNGLEIATIGTPSVPHNILVGKNCVPHIADVTTGSSTVFANDRAVARITDSIDSGTITTGSLNVFCS